MRTSRRSPSFPGAELDLRLCDCHVASNQHHFKRLRPFLSPVQVELSRIPFCFWVVHKHMKLTRDADKDAAFANTGTWETAQRAGTLLGKRLSHVLIDWNMGLSPCAELMMNIYRDGKKTGIVSVSEALICTSLYINLKIHYYIVVVFILYFSVFFQETSTLNGSESA